MSDMKKLNDEALENVTGGARRTVSNDSSSYSWVYELDDGNYIAGSLIGY